MPRSHELIISVIVRFHNEIKYLSAVYQAIRFQDIASNIEIISLNNNSSDGSIDVAKKYSDKVLHIDVYEPGKALNYALSESSGSIIVILSAHAIPGNRKWLANLLEPLINKNADNGIIATYGAQIYPYYSEFLDKRDLDIFNFAEPRKETIDSDFWNANSAFKRVVWEKYKFCETVYELEDHFWTKHILSAQHGYTFFNPQAYVYHYGHLTRIDRKYPNIKGHEHAALADKARNILSSTDEWAATMWAGLICNSVPAHLITAGMVDVLGKYLLAHPDFDVRWRMAQTLGNIPGDSSIRYLTQALDDRSFYPKNEAAWSLKKHLPDAIKEVEKKFDASKGETRLYAAFVLAHSNVRGMELKAIKYIEERLLNPDQSLLSTLYIAGEIAQSETSTILIPGILELVHCSNIADKCRAIAIWCLGRLYEYHVFAFPFDVLISILRLQCDKYIVCYESVNAICRYILKSNNIEKTQTLCACLNSQDGRVQYAICQALRVISENKGINVYRPAVMKEIKDNGAFFEIQSLISNHEVRNGTYWN
jgi:hypothetical protein